MDARPTSISAGLVAVALATGAAVALAPAAAATGEFGRHVSTCAKTHGFDGTHNPGLHRGASGWHHQHC